MKTVKIIYESYDTPHDPAPREHSLSLTVEDADAKKLLGIKTPFSRISNNSLASSELFTTLWSFEYLAGRYMIFGCKVLRIYEEGVNA